MRRSLNPLGDLGCHPWIELDSYNPLHFLKDFDSQVACTWANFEDNLLMA